jgi:hypothetical protein
LEIEAGACEAGAPTIEPAYEPVPDRPGCWRVHDPYSVAEFAAERLVDPEIAIVEIVQLEGDVVEVWGRCQMDADL